MGSPKTHQAGLRVQQGALAAFAAFAIAVAMYLVAGQAYTAGVDAARSGDSAAHRWRVAGVELASWEYDPDPGPSAGARFESGANLSLLLGIPIVVFLVASRSWQVFRRPRPATVKTD